MNLKLASMDCSYIYKYPNVLPYYVAYLVTTEYKQCKEEQRKTKSYRGITSITWRVYRANTALNTQTNTEHTDTHSWNKTTQKT